MFNATSFESKPISLRIQALRPRRSEFAQFLRWELLPVYPLLVAGLVLLGFSHFLPLPISRVLAYLAIIVLVATAAACAALVVFLAPRPARTPPVVTRAGQWLVAGVGPSGTTFDVVPVPRSGRISTSVGVLSVGLGASPIADVQASDGSPNPAGIPALGSSRFNLAGTQ